MAVTYKELKHPNTNETAAIEKTDADGTVWSIPLDPANSDYQRYLRWVENPDAEEQVLTFPIITEPLTEQTQEGEE